MPAPAISVVGPSHSLRLSAAFASLAPMRALVTGGAGFIGSTLTDRLLDKGHEVAILDNFSSGKEANLVSARKAGAAFKEIEHDIRAEDTRKVVADLKPEVVFHLAAQIDVRISVSDPVLDAQINIIGGLNVLEGARDAGVAKMVFASSGGTIYGAADDSLLPLDEDVKQQPLSPYGISKAAFGNYLHGYSDLHGMASSTLALSNVYGPRQDPHGEAGVVAIFSQRLLRGEPCTIFGDGKATRDYTYVDDIVSAFVASATAGSGLYNVGTGVETSATQLYELLAKAAGVDTAPGYAPARTGELQRSSLDSSRLTADTGWKPTVDIAEGSQRVLEAIRATMF